MRREVTLRFSAALVGLATVCACGGPASPPDPPVFAQHGGELRLNPSPVRELRVAHRGCFGPCPIYSVKLADDGTWEWEEQAADSSIASQTGRAQLADLSPLFIWLNDHPTLYAATADSIDCNDCEVVEFRFGLKSGESVVVRCGMGFRGDDWWALSNIVDAVIAVQRSRGHESHDRKPAT